MSKINKLGKSTFVIAILSFLLVAVLAFGGTYAYFSDAANEITGKVTTGTIQIDDTKTSTSEVIYTTDEVVPGAPVITEAVKVAPNVTVKTIVMAVVDIDIEGVAGTTITAEDLTFDAQLNGNNWDEVEVDGKKFAGDERVFVYKNNTAFCLDNSTAELNFTKGEVCLDNQVTNGTTAFENQGVKIDISIKFYAIQYEYLAGNGTANVGNYTSAEGVYEAVSGAKHGAVAVFSDLPALVAAGE